VKIEVGKKYVRRDGDVVTIVKDDGHHRYPLVSDKNDDYTNSGKFYDGALTDDRDLIREYVEMASKN